MNEIMGAAYITFVFLNVFYLRNGCEQTNTHFTLNLLFEPQNENSSYVLTLISTDPIGAGSLVRTFSLPQGKGVIF